VEQEERYAPLGTALVDHAVDLLALDRPPQVSESVQLGLCGREVVAVGPVGNQVPQRRVVGAALPAQVEREVEPACPAEAVPEVVDELRRERDLERPQRASSAQMRPSRIA
jgi:hypothetical protein